MKDDNRSKHAELLLEKRSAEAILERVKSAIFDAEEAGNFNLMDELNAYGVSLSQKIKRYTILLAGLRPKSLLA